MAVDVGDVGDVLICVDFIVEQFSFSFGQRLMGSL